MTSVLELRKLGKDYGERVAVKSVDLEVERGEILGLLGPNGAGKTTTISMACGVVTPSRGSVTIAGIALDREPFAAKAKLGLVPQDLALYEELTAIHNLRYFGEIYSNALTPGLRGSELGKRVDWALDVVGLRDRAREPVKQFSGGMKRRLNIAAGLVHKPELLILDEPTVGVDPQSRNYIFDTVRALQAGGMTVIYTSHYMEEVEALCDRVAIMDAGAIVALGKISELVAQYAGKGIELEIAGDAEAAARAAEAARQHRAGVAARDGAPRRLHVSSAADAAVHAADRPCRAALVGARRLLRRARSPRHDDRGHRTLDCRAPRVLRRVHDLRHLAFPI
ncbi:MAG: export transporter ATP-binding protein [Myxococcales bacterium]|nr:export transporter ATP-binding protein [Myxococcales bacterium]